MKGKLTDSQKTELVADFVSAWVGVKAVAVHLHKMKRGHKHWMALAPDPEMPGRGRYLLMRWDGSRVEDACGPCHYVATHALRGYRWEEMYTLPPEKRRRYEAVLDRVAA